MFCDVQHHKIAWYNDSIYVQQYAYNNIICTTRALLFSQSTITAIVRFNSAINITEHIFPRAHALFFGHALTFSWLAIIVFAWKHFSNQKKWRLKHNITYVMDFVFESIWIINQISVHTYNSPNNIFSLYWFHMLFPICCGHKINKCYQWIKSNRSNRMLYWGFTDIWMHQNECVWIGMCLGCLGKEALHLSWVSR